MQLAMRSIGMTLWDFALAMPHFAGRPRRCQGGTGRILQPVCALYGHVFVDDEYHIWYT